MVELRRRDKHYITGKTMKCTFVTKEIFSINGSNGCTNVLTPLNSKCKITLYKALIQVDHR
jgi:hypothetical protein